MGLFLIERRFGRGWSMMVFWGGRQALPAAERAGKNSMAISTSMWTQ